MLEMERIFGPFVNLPSEIQRIAVEVVYYYSPLHPQMQRALIACCCGKYFTKNQIEPV
jgi:hypothetical protein